MMDILAKEEHSSVTIYFSLKKQSKLYHMKSQILPCETVPRPPHKYQGKMQQILHSIMVSWQICNNDLIGNNNNIDKANPATIPGIDLFSGFSKAR